MHYYININNNMQLNKLFKGRRPEILRLYRLVLSLIEEISLLNLIANQTFNEDIVLIYSFMLDKFIILVF